MQNFYKIQRLQSLPETLLPDRFYMIEVDAENCDLYITDNAEPANAYFVSRGPKGDTGDAYESYPIAIFKSDGVDPGSYYADRRANANSTQAVVFVEIISGEAGSEIDIYLEVNGEIASGPHAVEFGAPLVLTGQTIAVEEGDTVGFVVAFVGGDVFEVFAKSYGAVA
jgi:hypothetical protein